MNLAKKLTAWQKADLITVRQMQDIETYEKQNSKPYMFFGLVALSFFCIGVGVISVIAANWQAIPAWIKLAFDFIFLSLSAGGAYYAFRNAKTSLFNGLIFLFAILIMASIGLIAQIYQLQPDGTAAYLLWSALVFPLLFFVRSALLPVIWLPIAWVSFWGYIIDHKIFYQTLQSMTDGWVYSVPILWLSIWAVFYQILDVYLKPTVYGLRKSLLFWLVVSIGTMIYFLDQSYTTSILFNIYGYEKTFNPSALSISLSMAIGLTALSAYLSYRGNKQYFLPFFMSLMIVGGLINLSFALSLIGLAAAGLYAYEHKRRGLFNFVLILAGIRIFMIYIQLFASLMSTGLGLIISGLVILLIIWGWLKTTSYFKGRLVNAKS